MQGAWTAVAAIALCLVCAPASAQGLVDAAKRAEESRKTSTTAPIAFDERDVNPLLAAREILEYEISDQRWPVYVNADDRVMDILENDLALYGRLELLRANSARMIERFLLREPNLLKALKTAGTDAHEYAYTSLAIGVAIAFIANDPGPEILEQIPAATKANMAFVRAHDEEIKRLLARGERLKARAEKANAAPKTAPATGQPAAAPRLSAYQVDEPRWRRLLAADKLVMQAVEREPRLYREMKKLNLLDEDPDDGVQALEQFVAREPALVAAVTAAGSTPQEYAYTQMAITVAATLLAADPPPPANIMENAPRAVKANFAFVRAHQPEVDEQHKRNVAFQQRMEKR